MAKNIYVRQHAFVWNRHLLYVYIKLCSIRCILLRYVWGGGTFIWTRCIKEQVCMYSNETINILPVRDRPEYMKKGSLLAWSQLRWDVNEWTVPQLTLYKTRRPTNWWGSVKWNATSLIPQQRKFCSENVHALPLTTTTIQQHRHLCNAYKHNETRV